MIKKKILIAGGTGLLGSSLTKILSKDKKNIVTSSYFTTRPIKEFKKYFKRYNFLNYKDCLKATFKKDIVIIAAVKAGGIKHLKDNPAENLIDNIKIRLNLFNASLKNNVRKVIWISSSTIYQPSKFKISENKKNFNINPYRDYLITGNIYRFLENILSYYKYEGLNINIIRTSSIYGPYDNFDPKKSHVIPALIKKIYEAKKNKIEIWGNPRVIRDFVYVEDLSNAINLLIDKNINQPINFSYGQGLSIIDLAKKIVKIFNKDIKFIFNNSKLTSAPYRVLDNKKFNSIFKKFKRTKIEEGLKKTIEWYINEKKKF